MCDSDDDCEGLLRKALDVELPANFNPNSVPQTGEEYLHHVIYERSKCKEWVVADLDRNQFQHNQTIKIQDDKIPSRNSSFAPSAEWQDTKIEEFKEFRLFLETQAIESHQTAFNEDDFVAKSLKSPPRFGQLKQHAQCSKIRMLQLIIKHLDGMESINDNLGAWIYGILSLLEIPLSPSSCHTLRELAKRCATLRTKLPANSDEPLYTPLNLCICIVAKYFNQLDLADC